jgi:hypothetical protein
MTEGMFADQAVTLDLDFPAARDQFLLLTHGNRLDGMSQDAYADGLAGQIRVGPLGGVLGMSKLVRVSLLDPVHRDESVLVPLRWEATGLMGRLFPVLDANLMLGKDDQGRGILRIAGVYRPPLGGLGEELDQIVLRRVASATIRSLLRRIAALLADRAGEPPGRDAAAGTKGSGDTRPGLPSGTASGRAAGRPRS